MPGGIRPRLARLTDPAMKKFISEAVAAQKRSPSAKGDKLLAELNKTWAEALKGFKEYERLLAELEQNFARVIQSKDLETLNEVQKHINTVGSRLKPIDANLKKFEAAEKELKALHKI